MNKIITCPQCGNEVEPDICMDCLGTGEDADGVEGMCLGCDGIGISDSYHCKYCDWSRE